MTYYQTSITPVEIDDFVQSTNKSETLKAVHMPKWAIKNKNSLIVSSPVCVSKLTFDSSKSRLLAQMHVKIAWWFYLAVCIISAFWILISFNILTSENIVMNGNTNPNDLTRYLAFSAWIVAWLTLLIVLLKFARKSKDNFTMNLENELKLKKTKSNSNN